MRISLRHDVLRAAASDKKSLTKAWHFMRAAGSKSQACAYCEMLPEVAGCVGSLRIDTNFTNAAAAEASRQ
ncbi:hypothetical protein ABGN05_13855 [Aquibium sp. LZ166]|uniref:Uncharacterized protein n=1 Tax=Aquibium pacificus TaxID=3153579 RepID=A0ABV3SJ27_9HYPH